MQETEIKLLAQEIRQLRDGNSNENSSDEVPAELAQLLLQNTKLKHRLAVLKRVSGDIKFQDFPNKFVIIIMCYC